MSAPDSGALRLFGRPALHVTVFATLVVSILFLAFPDIDLAVAGAFHGGGNTFLLRDTPVHRFVDASIRPGVKTLVVLMLVLAAVSLATRGRMIGWRPRPILYVALTFALGPGLLVNGLLKSFIGRARPKHLAELGGDKLFSPAYVPADQCAGNCSFVSGDVAMAFATIAFALLLAPPYRRTAVLASLCLGAVVGFYRMATGAHFLSDVVLAGLFCIAIALALHTIILPRTSAKRDAA